MFYKKLSDNSFMLGQSHCIVEDPATMALVEKVAQTDLCQESFENLIDALCESEQLQFKFNLITLEAFSREDHREFADAAPFLCNTPPLTTEFQIDGKFVKIVAGLTGLELFFQLEEGVDAWQHRDPGPWSPSEVEAIASVLVAFPHMNMVSKLGFDHYGEI